MRTAVGVLTAAITAIWLFLLGVELVYVWALLQLVLNYIPTFGSLVADLVIGTFALLQLGLVQGVIVLGGLIVIEQVMGNYLDSRLQGRASDVSPLLALAALVFWSWIWGISGALLAIPITATMIAVCAHFPALRPLAVLLSGSGDTEEAGAGSKSRPVAR